MSYQNGHVQEPVEFCVVVLIVRCGPSIFLTQGDFADSTALLISNRNYLLQKRLRQGDSDWLECPAKTESPEIAASAAGNSAAGDQIWLAADLPVVVVGDTMNNRKCSVWYLQMDSGIQYENL